MKTHTAIGGKLLAPLRTMNPVLDIVLHHHERWDGKGYPSGLAGEKIPYLARVFQLLDAYDALTHVRPYKKAMTREDALKILEAEALDGKWDPTISAAYFVWKREEG